MYNIRSLSWLIISLLLPFGVFAQVATNVIQDTGRVGVFTTSPGVRLSVYDTPVAAAAPVLRISAGTGLGLNSGGAIEFYTGREASPMGRIYIQNEFSAGPGNSRGKLVMGSYWNGFMDEITLSEGMVGIGTKNPQSLLAVEGTITAKQLNVTQTGWSDFVFDSTYQRMALDKVASYVREHKHLPDIPSATQIEQGGLDIGAMEKLHMQKIEELTLYAIDADKQIKEEKTVVSEQQTLLQQFQLQLQLQQKQLQAQQQEIEQLKQQVKGHQ